MYARVRARESDSWELMAKQCEVGIDVLGRLIIGYRKKGVPRGLRNNNNDRTNSIDFPTEKAKAELAKSFSCTRKCVSTRKSIGLFRAANYVSP